VACCLSLPLLWSAQQPVPVLDCAQRHTFRSSAAVWLRSQVPAEAREVFPSAQLDPSNGQRMVQSAVVLQDPRGQVLIPVINPKPHSVHCLGIASYCHRLVMHRDPNMHLRPVCWVWKQRRYLQCSILVTHVTLYRCVTESYLQCLHCQASGSVWVTSMAQAHTVTMHSTCIIAVIGNYSVEMVHAAQNHVCNYKAKWTYDPAVATQQKLVTRIQGVGWRAVCTALGFQQFSVARFTATDMNNM